jgi:Fur family transcriptional regulator, ferric uptake regulator
MQRDTRQRRAIRRAFERASRPLSPPEVLEQAKLTVPNLGLATVYRTVKSLMDEQWLRAVELPGAVPRYEQRTDHHHHYFQCRGCGRAFEIPGCPGNLSQLLPSGFQLEGHEVVLYGQCQGCVRANAS